MTPTASPGVSTHRLRPYLLAYLATLAGLLLLAAAVGAVGPVRDLAHTLVPFDWRIAPHDPNAHDVATALSLWFHNARVALAPLAAAAAVQTHRGRLRRAGDLLLGVVFAANVIPLAVELGTWGSRLLPVHPERARRAARARRGPGQLVACHPRAPAGPLALADGRDRRGAAAARCLP